MAMEAGIQKQDMTGSSTREDRYLSPDLIQKRIAEWEEHKGIRLEVVLAWVLSQIASCG